MNQNDVQCSTLEIGECAKQWATKALAGPDVKDLHWLIAAAFVAGGAEQAKREGTYPTNDVRPSDPVDLARAVTIELRKHMSVMPKGIHVIVARIGATRTGYAVIGVQYDLTAQVFDGLGPVAIANEIWRDVVQAKE